MTDQRIEELIRARLSDGVDPNGIEAEFDAALEAEAVDWCKWGDERWRRDTVCAKCGSVFAGVCGGKTKDHPFGQPCTSEPAILRSEYERRKAEAPR